MYTVFQETTLSLFCIILRLCTLEVLGRCLHSWYTWWWWLWRWIYTHSDVL